MSTSSQGQAQQKKSHVHNYLEVAEAAVACWKGGGDKRVAAHKFWKAFRMCSDNEWDGNRYYILHGYTSILREKHFPPSQKDMHNLDMLVNDENTHNLYRQEAAFTYALLSWDKQGDCQEVEDYYHVGLILIDEISPSECNREVVYCNGDSSIIPQYTPISLILAENRKNIECNLEIMESQRNLKILESQMKNARAKKSKNRSSTAPSTKATTRKTPTFTTSYYTNDTGLQNSTNDIVDNSQKLECPKNKVRFQFPANSPSNVTEAYTSTTTTTTPITESGKSAESNPSREKGELTPQTLPTETTFSATTEFAEAPISIHNSTSVTSSELKEEFKPHGDSLTPTTLSPETETPTSVSPSNETGATLITTPTNSSPSIPSLVSVGGGSSCDNCGKTQQELGRRSLVRCVLCQKAFYCSRKCQVRAWKNGHKKACRKPGRIEFGDILKLQNNSRLEPKFNGDDIGGRE